MQSLELPSVKSKARTVCFVFAFWGGTTAWAQNVELFGGQSKTTQDVMFFKFFEKPQNEDAPRNFLYFFRARSSVGYEPEHNLPQFGLTAAVSYNPKMLQGFAPVLVGQFFNSGVYAKAGVQYAYVSGQTTFFAWTVCQLKSQPSIDVFFIARHIRPANSNLSWFFQAEALGTFPTVSGAAVSLTQRARLGLAFHRFQMGPGIDFTQSGIRTMHTTVNPGGFVRFDF